MTIQQDIQGALQARLDSVAGVDTAAISFEGLPFQKAHGSTWFQVQFRPQLPVRVGWGNNPEWVHRGLFLVNVNMPTGSGTGDATELADTIIDAFRADPWPNQNGVYVHVLSAGRTGVIDAAGEITVPVTVSYEVNENS